MMRAFLNALRGGVSIPRMPGVDGSKFTGESGGVTIEQILIQVEKLDSDRDLDELAQKLGDKFAKAMTTRRGTAIGNLRIR